MVQAAELFKEMFDSGVNSVELYFQRVQVLPLRLSNRLGDET